MAFEKRKNELVEIFGYSPDDASGECRILWKLGGCQFTGRACTKHNHDKTITYGVCSVTTPYGDCIICPNRLYAQDFMTLRTISKDAFGGTEFMMFPTYLERRPFSGRAVIAMGMYSGHEIGAKGFSMDWVLAEVSEGKLRSYTGAEVQSLDITGNYRDAWYAYKNMPESSTIPKSGHGLNWANVHKRLIPQIIRKSLMYSKSPFVRSGLYFIVPDVVYVKFEDILGKDMPLTEDKAPNIITVFTWGLGPSRGSGKVRELLPKRKLRFSIEDFAERFISGPTLPSHEVLDIAVKQALGVD